MILQSRFARNWLSDCWVVSAVLLFGQSNLSVAGVIPATVVTDTPLVLNVTWAGTGLLDDGANNDSLAVPALTNWTVGPNPITLTYLGGGDGWTGILTVQHIAVPHPGDGLGLVAQFNIAFDQLAPTNSTTTKTVGHGPHQDTYTLTYSYVPATDTFAAELKGVHVPEPTSLALLCTGAFGMIGARLRRRCNR